MSCRHQVVLKHWLSRGPSLFCCALRKVFCDVQGNINLIEAAAKKGVKKFILLTSIGVGNSKDAPPQQVYDVLKPVLIEKGKAEEKLKVCHLARPHFCNTQVLVQICTG